MPQINVVRREVSCKLVYYGPGLSGKTTNLEVVHKKAPEEKRGPLTSVATQGERTLFFDFMALDLGTVGGLTVKLQLYTVPGQAYYQATRKLVLKGVDGLVFVADSQPDKQAENLESLRDLEENLREQGESLAKVPHVIQWNKRDMPGALPVEVLDETLNPHAAPSFEAVALTGEGVFPTLRMLAQLVLEALRQQFGVEPTAREIAERRARRRRPEQAPASRPREAAPPARPPEQPTRSAERPAQPAEPPPQLPTRPAPPIPRAPEIRGPAPQEPARSPWPGRVLLTALAVAACCGLGAARALPPPVQAWFEQALALARSLLQ